MRIGLVPSLLLVVCTGVFPTAEISPHPVRTYRLQRLEATGFGRTPVAVATGDLNADGITDLVVGFSRDGTPSSASGPAGGVEIFVGAGPRSEAVFVPSPVIIELPDEVDLLGVGDFDGDGHTDVLAARRGAETLHFLAGTGAGRLAPPTALRLPGRMTDLVTGDVGKRDGLADVVLGLQIQGGAGVVILHGGRVGFGVIDQVHPVEGTIRALSILPPDSSGAASVAVATGSGMTILERGRGSEEGGADSEALIAPEGHTAAADRDLPFLDEEGIRVIATLPVRLNGDALDDLVILTRESEAPLLALTAAVSTFVVANTNDAGAGSLRQAILDANASPGVDAIHFAIPGAGPHTIRPLSALPPITDPVTLDATTQPSFAGTPIIELSGESSGPSSGLEVTAGSSVIRGLAINRFASGLVLTTNGGNVVEGNHIGVDPPGSTDRGNAFHGIRIDSSNGNTIGGATAAARNVISGNDNVGVSVGAGTIQNVILGNFIGTDRTGASALPNGTGVGLDGQSGGAGSVRVGGPAAGAGNVISGNAGTGLYVGGTTAGHLVQGNHIGASASGLTALGNGGDGVAIQFGSCCNTIGGAATGAGNVISGNAGNGVRVDYHTNAIRGNWIGAQAGGVSPLGNGGHGVFVNFSSNNTVGGVDAGAGNVIAYNGGQGVALGTASVGNAILSNAIHSNARLGVDLGPEGASPNDAGDADMGSNAMQNHPVITSATDTGAAAQVDGALDSAPAKTFRIEFFSSAACDPSGHGEGEVLLGATAVTTDGSGHAGFLATLAAPPAPGSFITATATDASGNTSEFSRCAAAVCSATAPTGSLDLRFEGDRLAWDAAPSAGVYDVVGGDLSTLLRTGGDFTAATGACLANDLAATSLDHGGIPPAGSGFWFLARPSNCAGTGSYDSGAASQADLRDDEIAASPNRCP